LSGARASRRLQLAWVDRKGATLATVGESQEFSQFSLSPDERTAALEVFDAEGHVDLWLMDIARGVMSRLTAAAGDERDPVWAPDGRSIVFATRTAKGASLVRKGLRGSDPETVILPLSHDENLPEQWLRDGQTLLVTHRNPDKDEQAVSAVAMAGGTITPAIAGVRLDEPQVSPDGRWIAYVSRESGRDEVYVEPFRRDGTRVQISPAGGGQPKWRGDGGELYFVTPKLRLAAVTLRTSGETLDASLPTELFDVHGYQGTGLDDYVPSADGKRFLVKLPADRPSVPELHVVTNWTSLVH